MFYKKQGKFSSKSWNFNDFETKTIFLQVISVYFIYYYRKRNEQCEIITKNGGKFIVSP